MDFKIFNFKFGHVISHTFPGLLFLFTLSLALIDTFTINQFVNFLSESADTKELRVSTVAVILILASVFGMILDSFQHFAYGKIKKSFHPDLDYKIYNVQGLTKDKIEIYEKLFENQYHFYYEFYANTSLSIIPLFFATAKLGFLGLNSCFSFLVVLIVFSFLSYQAFTTFIESIKIENQLSENL